jgi:hypothetical protein
MMVTVHHSQPPIEGTGVFAEFRTTEVGPSLALYQSVAENEISSLMMATFVVWEAGIGARYSFNPNRKWKYHISGRSGEFHVFSVY